MRTLPAGLPEQDLVTALSRSWRLAAGRLRYVPEGGGSYHWAAEADGARYFLTVDDLRSKPWLGAGPDAAFDGLRAAFGTALALSSQARLPFVVPPVPTVDGATAVRVTARYSLAVFPFVDGDPQHWGDEFTPGDAGQVAGLLAELHRSTVTAPHASRDALRLAERPVLDAALAELGRPWAGGPFAEPVRRELAANAGRVAGWLSSFDELAAQVAARSAGDVITHGEPHPGNLIRVAGQFRLIDWDTVALAPPERDLWMLDGAAGAFDHYRAATGRAVDGAAVSCYRLEWALKDLAAFTGLLRGRHQRDKDTEKAWWAFLATLHPGIAPGPYRHLTA
ncbi:MAG TPA: phosphotransferase [Streptosporangiaceae bacterium]